MRSAILSRVFPLEADTQPRKPETWEEVAEFVEIELETRADARVISPESAHAVMPGSKGYVLTCGYCKRHDHRSEMCLKQAADLRGESSKCVVDYERSGRACAICQHGDHIEEHDRLAMRDYATQHGTPPVDGRKGGKAREGVRPG